MRKELFFGIGRRARPAALFLASTLPGVALAQRQQGPPGSRGEQSAQEATPQAEVELETGITLTRSGRFAEAIPHFQFYFGLRRSFLRGLQEATPQAEVELETGITLTRSGRFQFYFG